MLSQLANQSPLALTLKIIIFLSLFVCTLSQCLTSNDKRLTNQNSAQKSLYEGQQDFSLKMFKELNRQHPNENIFFSPYSNYHALLLAYFIAKGDTENGLKTALRIPEHHDKIDVFNAYNYEKLKHAMGENAKESEDDYEFDAANKIYVASQINLRQCMLEILKDEIEKIDFNNDPEKARLYINQWIENKTRDQIKELLKPGLVTKDTNLALVNAAYFKGKWASRFDAGQTKQQLFYISQSEKTWVDMMKQENHFNYDISEDLGAHILELPYKGSNISMFIFLPPFVNNDANIENVLSKLNSSSFLNVVERGALRLRNVTVFLPKFTLEKTYSVRPVFEAMGVNNLFTRESDLSGLTEEGEIDLGDATHKVKLEVDEQGTVAAAATIAFTFRTSRPVEPVIFKCNHPFIYTIYDFESQSILFLGVYRKPEEVNEKLEI